MFAASGEDNQITQVSIVIMITLISDVLFKWDLAVEREANEDVDLPPQLLFVHQGQEDIKELHWHTDVEGMILSTANTGFNVFKTISV